VSYKSLLIHVEPTPESNLRLRVAVDLARGLGATLIGVGGNQPIYLDNAMLMTGYGDGAVIQTLVDLDTATLTEAEARFHATTGSLGAEAIWLSERDYPDHALQVCAAGADLIIASAHRGPKASTAAAVDLVLRAGLPILTVPTDLPAIRTKNIVIAWKNTREARRAVSDALPLLIAADEVTVLHVCPTVATTSAAHSGLDDVVARLIRHGVRPSVTTLERPSSDTFQALTRFAEEQLADLIVAGAYGHSRAGEWMLGGVTQDLLAYSPLPVLFSH
jgi:nucleotide-binding universal stress UspA family protein